MEGIDYDRMDTRIVEGVNTADVIIEESKDYDLITLGASEEPILKNYMVGPLSEKIAQKSNVTVMMIKRRSGPLHSFVRKALLEPTQPKSIE